MVDKHMLRSSWTFLGSISGIVPRLGDPASARDHSNVPTCYLAMWSVVQAKPGCRMGLGGGGEMNAHSQ